MHTLAESRRDIRWQITVTLSSLWGNLASSGQLVGVSSLPEKNTVHPSSPSMLIVVVTLACPSWCNLILHRVKGSVEAMIHEDGRGSEVNRKWRATED